MIGIIGAMAEEINELNNILTDKEIITINNISFCKGKLNGVEVITNICGIGKVFAAMSSQLMIVKFAPSLIINIGAGGSLSSDIHITDIVIAVKTCQHDIDVSPIGFKRGEIVGPNKIWFDCDKNAVAVLDECATQLHLKHHLANIVTGDTFVNSNEQKQSITSQFDGQVCEMEGSSIAQVCFTNNTPFVVIRAVSDEADCNASTNFLSLVDKVIIDAINLLKLAIVKL